MPADQLTAPATPAGATWWRQFCVEFPDWDASERAFTAHLAPLLRQAQDAGLVGAWWFMRKHPCWRLRLRPVAGSAYLDDAFPAALGGLAEGAVIRRWQPGVYEAEEAAFGGPDGMAAAHRLFAADSAAVTGFPRRPPDDRSPGLGRRELSVLLCCALLRGAGLEWYEQGDAWDLVARERPLAPEVTEDRITEMAGNLRTLLLADVTAASGLFKPTGPAAAAASWAAAFRDAGVALGTLSRSGELQRGLRRVLAYHVIFHWNRAGLPARQQAVLARAARTAILGPPEPDRRRPATTSAGPPVPAAARRLASTVLGRFPLVPRPRLLCTDLGSRVGQVARLAAACTEPADPGSRVDLACSAWNQAALIAVDTGMTELAAGLCKKQFAVFDKARPVTGPFAIAALQPLVNLARLDIRCGRPGRGYETLIQMPRAVRDGGTAEAGGITFRLDEFRVDSDSPAAGWLREVLLQDGTRALIAAGEADRAAEHAAWYDDQPWRMREGRQARIIAAARHGDSELALTLATSAVPAEPWEEAVTACLRACVCLAGPGALPGDLIPGLASAWGACATGDAATVLFRVKVGLAAEDLAAALDPGRQHAISGIAEDAVQAGDGHAAREILRHPARTTLGVGRQRELEVLVSRAGLGRVSIPGPLINSLSASVDAAEAVLAATLAGLLLS